MQDFIKFIREQGVIGLAIGFILGGAISKIVSSLVTDIIQPIMGFLVGSKYGFASLRFHSFAYGNFLVTVI